MNIAVVGTGYVGLVTGTCFAETGNNVICVDINEKKVESLKNGKIPIFEPGLDMLFERNTKEGRLHFTTNLSEAVSQSQIIFLALPTPPGEDGSADLSYIMGVARDLSKIITDYKVIVDKSTVPVGTSEKVTAIISEKLSTDLFDVVSNPEFLREGVAVETHETRPGGYRYRKRTRPQSYAPAIRAVCAPGQPHLFYGRTLRNN